jgi:ligand-binding SRPBCC domain-containing protein
MPEHVITFASRLSVDRERLFDWHARPGAFTRLAPPWQALREIRAEGGIESGAQREIELRLGPLPVRWTAQHEQLVRGHQFMDRQVGGPFASWLHRHYFQSDGTGSRLIDEITFRLPLDAVADRLVLGAVRQTLVRTFRFRHQRTRMDLYRHARWRDAPRQRFIIGPPHDHLQRQLVAYLSTAGHVVAALDAEHAGPSPAVMIWRNPGDARGALRRAVDRMQPSLVVVITEDGTDVLELLKLASAGTRCVALVHGPVLSSAYGFLPPMIRRARMGLPFARRIETWIQLDDLLAAIVHVVHDERAEGKWVIGGQRSARASEVAAAVQNTVSPTLPVAWPVRTDPAPVACSIPPAHLRPLSELGFKPWFLRFGDAVCFERGQLARLPDPPTGS